MSGDIDSINHAGLVTGDMDATATRYQELGFLLTPLSLHKGAPRPGESVSAWGSGNRCAIFERNYLEITAYLDKSVPNTRTAQLIAPYEGLRIICFGCDDAYVVDRRVTESGWSTSGVIWLQRDVDTSDGVRTAKFECVHFTEASAPDGVIQAAHHLTPEYIHQPRYMSHPNGAVALTEVLMCVDDPDRYQAKYELFLGRKGERQGVKRVFQLPLSRLSILGEGDLSDELPGETAPALPFIAAFAVATRDLAQAKAWLEEHNIPSPARDDGRLVVPAKAGRGAAVMFEQAR